MADPLARLNAALAGRYTVERQLGEGGMATVYLARDLKHDRSVALKVLKPELAAVVGADRFLAEIKTTANLQHPHILPLFDSGQAEGMLFYVMPYVEGESLRERLDRESQLPVDEAVRIATNVAEALDYAHSRGVIHRDIKPANILLQSGKPVVSDFGIALAVSAGGGGRLTETGLSLGTPHYMSPEQATGDARVGPPTDIYALGCVLYEMLVGEPPYTGSTPQAVLGRIISGEAVSATKQRATVPPNVDAVIRKALEKVPADRFASAQSFGEALGDRNFGYGASAVSPRHVAWRGAALLVAGGIVGAGAVALWSDSDAGPDVLGPMRFALPTIANDSLNSATLFQDVTISRDGRLIAYTGTSGADAQPQIFVRAMDRMDAEPLNGAVGQNPFFSPDGAWLGFVDAADLRTVKRVRVSGGEVEVVGTLPSSVNYVAGATWSVDDQIIVGTGAGTGLFRIPVSGGEPEHLTDGQHHWPSLIDGRDAVLMMSHNVEMSLAALDLRTGEVKPLGIDGTSPRYLATGHLVYAAADGSVWGVAFDATSLEAVGDPVRLFGGIQVKSGNEGAANFAVSDNGHLVLAAGTLGQQFTTLVAVGRDGSRRVLARIVGIAWYPRFSPDGSRLAFATSGENNANGASDLWVLDVLRGARTRVTFGGNNRFLPIWTRDGAFLTHADGSLATNRILRTAADGSGVADTLLPSDTRRFPTSWSPDGQTLAYYAGGGPDTSRDLWLMHMDEERAVEPFVATPFDEAGAVFSPDGRWLAYVSDKSGQNDVYARPFPGPGGEVTISVGGGAEPVWAPSGRALYYRHDGEIIEVPIDRSASRLAPGSPRSVLTDVFRLDGSGAAGALANYDVTPDGVGFVMVEDAVSGADAVPASVRIRVILNFFDELRARLPN